MKRVLMAVMVLTSVGCKREPAPAQSPTVQTQPEVPSAKQPEVASAAPTSAVVRVSPRQLLETYQDNEVAADMKYGGQRILEVTGLVREIRKDVTGNALVAIDAGDMMRAVQCRMRDDQMAAVAELSKGQLVSLHGVSRGVIMASPILDGCQIAWTGKKPKAKQTAQEDGNDALLAARSMELCIAPILVARMNEQGQRLPDGGVISEALFREYDTKQNHGTLTRAEETARKELSAAGFAPLPCDHPLVHLVMRCEVGSESEGKSGECSVPLVKNARAKLQR